MLANLEGEVYQVIRYERVKNGLLLHSWVMIDGRKLDPTPDGYLVNETKKTTFVMPNDAVNELTLAPSTSKPNIMPKRIPFTFKRYLLKNIDGESYQVTRYDRQVEGKRVFSWALKDGRKLEPTLDGHLQHAAGGIIFIMPMPQGEEDA